MQRRLENGQAAARLAGEQDKAKKLSEELALLKAALKQAGDVEAANLGLSDELASAKAETARTKREVKSLKATVEDRDNVAQSTQEQLAALKTMHEERMAQEQEAHNYAIAAAEQTITQQREALAKQQQAADAEAERRNECEQHISTLQLELQDSQEQLQSGSEALKESEAAEQTLQCTLEEETRQRRLENEQAAARLAGEQDKAKELSEELAKLNTALKQAGDVEAKNLGLSEELASSKADTENTKLEVEALKGAVEDRDTAVQSMEEQLAALKWQKSSVR
eukprot:TRINITY_DN5325_c0_g1_i13.p1 TRINITY_DN5325_c0_g1~~TRINITY_DN5325_c0_g1_i13.p1  ORF type:complete len:282 (+),score=118.44 TRINITY_DN5325_c0_g1_i13:300-1145(+)